MALARKSNSTALKLRLPLYRNFTCFLGSRSNSPACEYFSSSASRLALRIAVASFAKVLGFCRKLRGGFVALTTQGLAGGLLNAIDTHPVVSKLSSSCSSAARARALVPGESIRARNPVVSAATEPMARGLRVASFSSPPASSAVSSRGSRVASSEVNDGCCCSSTLARSKAETVVDGPDGAVRGIGARGSVGCMGRSACQRSPSG